MELTQCRSKIAKKHPCAELKEALMRFGAWGGSTGGVERLFGEGRAASGIKKRHDHDDLYADELMLVSDKNEQSVATLCARARDIWVSVYKTARTADRHMRLDVNTSKPHRLNTPTLARWIQNRRKTVRQLEAKYAQVSVNTLCTKRVVGRDGWTEKHQHELEFQQRKRAVRFIEAVEQGTIPESELSEDMKALLEQYHSLGVKREREAENKRKRKLRAVDGPLKVSLKDKCVYVDKVDVGDRARFVRVLREHGVKETKARVDADMYLVNSVEAVGQRIKWCCFLGGRTCCDLTYLQSGGERGLTVKYQSATSSRKWVWISAAFRTKHVELYSILMAMIGQKDSRWQLVDSKAAFLQKAGQVGAASRVIAFVSVAEAREEHTPRDSPSNVITPVNRFVPAGCVGRPFVRNQINSLPNIYVTQEEFRGRKMAFTAAAAERHWLRIDRHRSTMGACGR